MTEPETTPQNGTATETKRLSTNTKIKEVGRHSIIYGLGSVAQSVIGLVLLPILTDSLSKEDFGAYSLVMTATSVAGAIFYLGMNSALSRFYFDYDADHERKGIFVTALIITCCGALLQIAFGFYYGDVLSILLVGSDEYRNIIAWAFFGGAMTFVNQCLFSYLRLIRKSVSAVVASLLNMIFGIGLTLLLLKMASNALEAPFQAMVLTQTIVLLFFIFFYGKDFFVPHFSSHEVSRMTYFGISSIIASFGVMLLDFPDRLIIERFMTIADVGTYSAAFRVGTLINVLMILPFSQIWSPMMMEYRLKDDVKDLFTRVLSYFLILGGIIMVISSLFAADFLPLLIRSGVDANVVNVFLLTMLGTLLFGTVNILSAGLLYERKIIVMSYVYYMIAGIKIGVNLLFVPAFGITGAAMSTLLAYIIVPAWIYLLARRYFSFDVQWRRLAILMMNCAIPLFYGLYLSNVYDISFSIRLFCLLVVLRFMYRTCLTQAERQEIIHLLRMKLFT
ncbi:MAG: oligosaccharide flippase family protein [Magnetococcales bacterium]|nr:oligosaccharide flippase family protein [Magnetococcales bacterium]MBF0110693.1 oligosaccharide flippase family protein [Magnetococcales bacterium]MBF0116746.1 oligosaccharide flippase family protein [Magnetococcales bacterium]